MRVRVFLWGISSGGSEVFSSDRRSLHYAAQRWSPFIITIKTQRVITENPQKVRVISGKVQVEENPMCLSTKVSPNYPKVVSKSSPSGPQRVEVI